ncbi:sensor histidine kinase [Elstera cyanobacteriorum]|uniref:sensor histidine kinase n=1 Tax=Elstera cyanobacteriorum TaxID=2022747 RepID=UPI002352A877|nr:ATP-binding protein [Elstera cyanobacteriorum]MCK6442994.1 MCP four helix bundle domain-containing protein [Elstera cyanobacteriorum]
MLTSLRSKFALLFLTFIAVPAVLGVIGMGALQAVNDPATEIREVWLPKLRILAALNDHLSDFRLAEGDYMAAADEEERSTHAVTLARLGGEIAANIAEYRVSQPASNASKEAQAFKQFVTAWNTYREIATRLMTQAATLDRQTARQLYRTENQQAYWKASDLLDELTAADIEEAEASRDQAKSVYDDTSMRFIVIIVGVIGLAILAMAMVNRTISSPLIQLVGVLTRIPQRDFSAPVPHTGRRDEIGAIARAITVFREQAAELEETLRREHGLLTQQRNFITMASHEIRTPLTGIDGHARRLERQADHVAPAEIAERAGRIRAAVRRLTQVVESVTRAAQWDQDPAEVHLRPHALPSVLADIVQRAREENPQRAILLTCAPFPQPLRLDPALLDQAVTNLLGNALKYSDPSTTVSITARMDGDWALVEVEDQGIGIPEAEREQIRTRFFRASNARATVGSGVGLYIVDQIMAIHGGTMSIDSRLNEGTRVTLRLPLSSPISSPEGASL